MKTIETKLNEIIRAQFTSNLEGEQLTSTGTITHEEATFIMNLIIERGLTRCLETGVAFGASTIAICAALSKLAAAVSIATTTVLTHANILIMEEQPLRA